MSKQRRVVRELWDSLQLWDSDYDDHYDDISFDHYGYRGWLGDVEPSSSEDDSYVNFRDPMRQRVTRMLRDQEYEAESTSETDYDGSASSETTRSPSSSSTTLSSYDPPSSEEEYRPRLEITISRPPSSHKTQKRREATRKLPSRFHTISEPDRESMPQYPAEWPRPRVSLPFRPSQEGLREAMEAAPPYHTYRRPGSVISVPEWAPGRGSWREPPSPGPNWGYRNPNMRRPREYVCPCFYGNMPCPYGPRLPPSVVGVCRPPPPRPPTPAMVYNPRVHRQLPPTWPAWGPWPSPPVPSGAFYHRPWPSHPYVWHHPANAMPPGPWMWRYPPPPPPPSRFESATTYYQFFPLPDDSIGEPPHPSDEAWRHHTRSDM